MNGESVSAMRSEVIEESIGLDQQGRNLGRGACLNGSIRRA